MNSTDTAIQLQGSVWMSVGDEKFGGSDRMALLSKIAECGSITQAAKAVRMSYKAAWDAIDAMNSLAGEALVERQAGGKGGGGTRLTQRGQQLVENFKTIQKAHQRFLNQLAAQAQTLTDDYILIRRMAMKTSARNQFLGKITAVKTGAVNDEIELQTATGLSIVAMVTHESTKSLELNIGAEAFALIKSSAIILVTDDKNGQDVQFSARNQFQGTITRLQPGAVNTEVVITLEGGDSIAAIVTNSSCENMQLTVGKPARAIFKASSVIIAVPA